MLGQNDKLRNLRYPATSEEYSDTLNVLKQTGGYILSLRKAFDDLFKQIYKPTGLLRKIPRIEKKMKQNPIEYRGFSDSVIIQVPLRDSYENAVSANGVYSALVATCGMATISLAQGHPLRGGVDIGLGFKLTPTEIYGPVLARAYYLESREAQYPRVLVGSEICNYLSRISSLICVTELAGIAKSSAQDCQSIIIEDTEGKKMLDFLGPQIHSIWGGIQTHVETVQQAYQAVIRMHQHFHDQGNDKLECRYKLLREYFESRTHLWL